MSLHKQIDRLRRIHRFIKFKRTGPPAEFADKLQLSTSMLYKQLGYMREMGAPILYCPRRRSYVYSRGVEFQFGFAPTQTDVEVTRQPAGHEAVVRPLDTFSSITA